MQFGSAGGVLVNFVLGTVGSAAQGKLSTRSRSTIP